MGNLSKNFSRHEFECRCCGRAEINPRLVDALQQLRDLAGQPVRISSGYRCPEHNRAVGGATRSQHLLGNAADIVVRGLTPVEMYRLAEEVEAFRNGGIGLYPDKGFIHVDVRDGRARWGQLDGTNPQDSGFGRPSGRPEGVRARDGEHQIRNAGGSAGKNRRK